MTNGARPRGGSPRAPLRPGHVWVGRSDVQIPDPTKPHYDREMTCGRCGHQGMLILPPGNWLVAPPICPGCSVGPREATP